MLTYIADKEKLHIAVKTSYCRWWIIAIILIEWKNDWTEGSVFIIMTNGILKNRGNKNGKKFSLTQAIAPPADK